MRDTQRNGLVFHVIFLIVSRYALPDVPSATKTLSHHPLSTGTFAHNGNSHTLHHPQHPHSHPNNHHALLGNGGNNGVGGGAFSPDNSFHYETYHRPSNLPPTPMNGLGHATNQTNSTTMTGPRSMGGGSSTYQSIGTPDEQDSTRTMTIHIQTLDEKETTYVMVQ